MKNSFVFYTSFYEAIKELPPDIQLEVYNSVSEYALFGNIVKISGVATAIFTLIKPTLDKPMKSLRNCGEYQQWRLAVLQRDKYTCQKCNKKNTKLHVHHIKMFSKRPDLIFDINNGITLCERCHRNIHKKAGCL